MGKAAAGGQRQHKTRLNFRSNIVGIVKLVNSAKLRERHLQQLKWPPFWLMIEAIHVNNLNHNEFRKYAELIFKIINAYNPRENAFNIGGSCVKLGSCNVRLLFGLQYGKRRIDLPPGQRLVSDIV